MTRRNGRILAFQALFAWEVGNIDPAQLITFSWSKSKNQDDFTFSTLLFLGTLENIEQIDNAIRAHLINWDFTRINKIDLSILRLSVYTLLFQTDMHPTIIIDEAIDIAKEFSLDESYKFINAVLDNIRKKSIQPVKETP